MDGFIPDQEGLFTILSLLLTVVGSTSVGSSLLNAYVRWKPQIGFTLRVLNQAANTVALNREKETDDE